MGAEKYPEDFRFKCDMEKFKQCVDIARHMMDNKYLFILFGSFREFQFKVTMNKENYNKCYSGLDYGEFRNILKEEVGVIILQNIVEPELEEANLENYLEKEITNPNMVKEILAEKYEKRKYVRDMLMDSGMISRYWLKKKTLNHKLSGLDYELNRFVFKDNTDILYATIQIETAKMPKNENVSTIFAGNSDKQTVSFVCDKQDLEYIIEHLERIKERM